MEKTKKYVGLVLLVILFVYMYFFKQVFLSNTGSWTSDTNIGIDGSGIFIFVILLIFPALLIMGVFKAFAKDKGYFGSENGFAVVSTFFIILLLSIGAYHMYQQKNEIPSNTSVACPADAKICEDGSSVGRTGPNCEFVCPEDNI